MSMHALRIADPRWLATAKRDIGLRELPGAQTAPKIAAWLADLGAWWRDDETPWCGAAMAAWARAAGFKTPATWYRAASWATWGESLPGPVLGCVVVLTSPGGNHVGIVCGRDADGNLVVLGGNQGNAVSMATFSRSRAIAYRWPSGEALHEALLPVGQVPGSLGEA
jgi:uncharacterized protein (TIGR02594 family)